MIFNSIEFFIFLPLVYFLYCISKHKSQNILLLLASYVFYGWWDIRFLYLIALSTGVDYCCGFLIRNGKLTKEQFYKSAFFIAMASIAFLGLANVIYTDTQTSTIKLVSGGLIAGLAFFLAIHLCQKHSDTSSEQFQRKIYLLLSMTINLGILGIFKYFNFFVESAQTLLLNLGAGDVAISTLHIVLPVGISFYTFQTMSYSIDIYRNKLEPCEKFIDFALFVSYFPQLVAGPIERAANLLPKIIEPRSLNWPQIESGIRLIAYGMFKKVVIADGLAVSISSIYGSTGGVTSLDVIVATLFFTLQIYCDFSGYSDIARGISKMLGIELMVNFKLPYFSRSPSEFWQRWHISLSSWLRDYLYISLGGNRGSKFATYKNLMLTMLLGGLWHGAAWNFLLWGGYQGLLLCSYRLLSQNVKLRWESSPILRISWFWLSMLIFFMFTCYGWLLFRAESFAQIADFTALLFSESIFNGEMTISRPPLSAIFGIPILLGYEFLLFTKEHSINPFLKLNRLSPLLYGFMIFIFIAALSSPPAQFIYFQF